MKTKIFMLFLLLMAFGFVNAQNSTPTPLNDSIMTTDSTSKMLIFGPRLNTYASYDSVGKFSGTPNLNFELGLLSGDGRFYNAVGYLALQGKAYAFNEARMFQIKEWPVYLAHLAIWDPNESTLNGLVGLDMPAGKAWLTLYVPYVSVDNSVQFKLGPPGVALTVPFNLVAKKF